METYVRHPNCKCATCAKDIYRRPKQIESGSVYCSNDCYGKSCLVLIPCTVCGDGIPSRLNKKTCNRTCSNKLRIGMKYKSGRPSKDKVKTNKQLKLRLIEQRGELCEMCKDPKAKILHVHHVIRRCDGGSNELSNLRLICPNCHAEEHYGKNS